MKKRANIICLFLLSAISLFLTGCFAPAPNIPIPPKAPPPVPIVAPRVALVLGGGGARAYAHLGVIKVLEQNHIPIDVIVGASAGTLVGALYADNPHIKALTHTIFQASEKDIFDMAVAHPFSGFATGNRMQWFLLKHMRARNFNQLKIPLVAVATNFATGQAVPLRSGPIAPAANASAAVPVIFRPVHLYGMSLVDGGVADPVPADIAASFHPKIIIAVNINKAIAATPPAGSVGILLQTYNITSDHLADHILKQANIVLYPDVAQIGLFDLHGRDFLIKAGELVAQQALPIIKAQLKAAGIKLDKKHS